MSKLAKQQFINWLDNMIEAAPEVKVTCSWRYSNGRYRPKFTPVVSGIAYLVFTVPGTGTKYKLRFCKDRLKSFRRMVERSRAGLWPDS